MTTPNIEELRLLAQTLEFSDAVRCSIQRAADLLQSQAERIKELESEVEMWKATANAVVDFEKVQLRAQLTEIAATEPAPSLTKIEDPVTVPRGLLGAACRAIAHKDDAPNTLEQLRQYTVGNLSPSMTGKAARSLDKAWSLFCSEIGEDKSPYPGMIGAFEAHYGQSFKDKDWRNEASVWAQAWSAATRDQLAAIAATEPVAWRWVWKSKPWDIEGWCYTNTPPNHPELQEIEPLFTRPMPAQRLTELKLLMLTTAYEQGVGKGIQRRDCNPYAADTDEHAAWKLGYEEGLDKPMPAQDVAELVEAAYDKVQRLIVDRYHVEKSIGGFWPCCVKAGDGTMDIFVGSKKQAENVRQALQTACLDGAFMASKALSKYKGVNQ